MSTFVQRFVTAGHVDTRRSWGRAGKEAFTIHDTDTLQPVAYVAFYAPSGPELPPAVLGTVAGFDLFRLNPRSSWIAQGDLAKNRSGAIVLRGLEIRQYDDEVPPERDPLDWYTEDLPALVANEPVHELQLPPLVNISSDILREVPLGLLFEALGVLAQVRHHPFVEEMYRQLWGERNWLTDLPSDHDLAAPRKGPGRPKRPQELLRDVAIAALHDSQGPGRNERLAKKFGVTPKTISDWLSAARADEAGWLEKSRAGSRDLRPGPRLLKYMEGDQ